MPVLTSKKQFKRSHVTTGKPKKQKSKTLLRGPKLLDFLVFLGFFLVFQQKSKKIAWSFGILGGKPKNTGFFWFSCSPFCEKPKNPVFVLDFCWKTKKTPCVFWISVRKPKNLGKPKIQKFRAPQAVRKVLDFWIFGSLSLIKRAACNCIY